MDGESVFVQVEKFAEIEDHSRLGPVETDIDGAMELLANRAAALSVRRGWGWIRQSESALLHRRTYINSVLEGRGARSTRDLT